MKSIRSILAALFTTAGFAAPTPKPAAKAPADMMRELRLQWLTRPPPSQGGTEKPEAVTAALMDWPLDEATVTVLASSVGDASLYTMATFGIMGGIGHEGARNAALLFVQNASKHLGLSSPTTDYSYPDRGHVRFFFMTRSGVRSVTFSTGDVQKQGTDAYDLYAHAQQVVTELRLITQNEQRT